MDSTSTISRNASVQYASSSNLGADSEGKDIVSEVKSLPVKSSRIISSVGGSGGVANLHASATWTYGNVSKEGVGPGGKSSFTMICSEPLHKTHHVRS